MVVEEEDCVQSAASGPIEAGAWDLLMEGLESPLMLSHPIRLQAPQPAAVRDLCEANPSFFPLNTLLPLSSP